MHTNQPNIPANATWSQTGITVAGGNHQGKETNQLYHPHGLFVDDEQTIYIADYTNDRIIKWKSGATSGEVVAGGNGYGDQNHQLNEPSDVIIDKETNSLIICDTGNQRVVRWPCQYGKSGEILISKVFCTGLTMDEEGSLYVANTGLNQILKYRRGATQGDIVSYIYEERNDSNELWERWSLFIGREHSIYISDPGKHRVLKCKHGAKQEVLVTGGQGGDSLSELYSPRGIVVDQLETVYVADELNNRIMRWPKGAKQGSVIIGGNGKGDGPNQLNYPIGLSFDRYGNLYVVDSDNSRVQRFDIEV